MEALQASRTTKAGMVRAGHAQELQDTIPDGTPRAEPPDEKHQRCVKAQKVVDCARRRKKEQPAAEQNCSMNNRIARAETPGARP